MKAIWLRAAGSPRGGGQGGKHATRHSAGVRRHLACACSAWPPSRCWFPSRRCALTMRRGSSTPSAQRRGWPCPRRPAAASGRIRRPTTWSAPGWSASFSTWASSRSFAIRSRATTSRRARLVACARVRNVIADAGPDQPARRCCSAPITTASPSAPAHRTTGSASRRCSRSARSSRTAPCNGR